MATSYIVSNLSDYNLWDSFILDSSTIVHVYNSYKYFSTIIPAFEDDLLYTSNMVILIKGFGSVDGTVQILVGLKLIEL